MALKKIGGSNLKRSRSFKDFSVNFDKNPFTDDLSVVNNDNSIKQAIKHQNPKEETLYKNYATPDRSPPAAVM